MKRLRVLLAFTAIILAAAFAPARADMLGGIVSPADQFVIFHLLFLNLIVAAIEWLIVRFAFRMPSGVAGFLSIVAGNYLSAWLGFWLLLSTWQTYVEPRIVGAAAYGNELHALVALVVIAFITTILIEWPFFALALIRSGASWKKRLGICAVSQVATYILLIALYLSVCKFSFLTAVKLVPASQVAHQSTSTVYYASNSSNQIWSIRTDGTGNRIVASSNSDLDSYSIQPAQTAEVCEITGTVPKATYIPGNCDYIPVKRERDVLDLRTARPLTWFVYRPHHMEDHEHGIQIDDKNGAIKLDLDVDCPFDMWYVDNLSVTPDGLVVFALIQSNEQTHIMLLDPTTRRIAFLASGYRPFVVADATGTMPRSRQARHPG